MACKMQNLGILIHSLGCNMANSEFNPLKVAHCVNNWNAHSTTPLTVTFFYIHEKKTRILLITKILPVTITNNKLVSQDIWHDNVPQRWKIICLWRILPVQKEEQTAPKRLNVHGKKVSSFVDLHAADYGCISKLIKEDDDMHLTDPMVWSRSLSKAHRKELNAVTSS